MARALSPAWLTYDDTCPLCATVARALRRVDRSGLAFVPLSDTGTVDRIVGPFFAPGPWPWMFHFVEGDALAFGATAIPAILRRVLWRPTFMRLPRR